MPSKTGMQSGRLSNKTHQDGKGEARPKIAPHPEPSATIHSGGDMEITTLAEPIADAQGTD